MATFILCLSEHEYLTAHWATNTVLVKIVWALNYTGLTQTGTAEFLFLLELIQNPVIEIWWKRIKRVKISCSRTALFFLIQDSHIAIVSAENFDEYPDECTRFVPDFLLAVCLKPFFLQKGYQTFMPSTETAQINDGLNMEYRTSIKQSLCWTTLLRKAAVNLNS